MATDALISLAASATVTATTNGTAITLVGGTPRRGLVARVIYSAGTATAADTVTFSVDVSYDGGSTYYSDFLAPPVTLATSGSGASGEIHIPFSISPTSVANGTKVRLTATFSSTAHTDTITYSSDIEIGRP